MTAPRKAGQRKADLSDETTERILKVAKSLVRTDFGGKPAEEVIRNKAREKGLDLGPKTCIFIKEIVEEQVEGCRKRVFPRVDEAIARISGIKGYDEASP